MECLARLKADIVRFGETEKLNGFQKWITYERYILDPPELAFVPGTIIIAAVKFTLVKVVFHYNGRSREDVFCVKRKGVKDRVQELFAQNGYNIEYIHWLPQKRLAVCSGLAEYGRNNITYIDGWGSFYELQTYMTDMPCEQEYVWRDICCMDICGKCKACINNCPTKAISGERFLIENEVCLARLNELETPFPDWVPRSAHHSAYGCYKCQDICPKNKSVLANISETERFAEDETALLLAGTTRDGMPESLLGKIERLGIADWLLKVIPKNLRAMFGYI